MDPDQFPFIFEQVLPREILWQSGGFKDIYRMGRTIRTGNMSSHSGNVIMFDVKQMFLDPVYNSVSGLTHIFNIGNTGFHAINLIIALTNQKCL